MDVHISLNGSNGDWIQIFAAIAGPLAAFVAVGIAWWQSRILQRQFDQSLYKTRLDVYLAIRGFLADFAIRGTTDLAQSIQLLRNTKESEFLFEPDVTTLIDKIYAAGVRWRTLDHLQRKTNETPTTEQLEIENWLAVGAHTETEGLFRPYLQLYRPRRRFRISRRRSLHTQA